MEKSANRKRYLEDIMTETFAIPAGKIRECESMFEALRREVGGNMITFCGYAR